MKNKHIDLEFEMEIYDAEMDEELFITVQCTGVLGSTGSMGDSPTDFYAWSVFGYTLDDLPLGDITEKLTIKQWSHIEEKAYDLLQEYN